MLNTPENQKGWGLGESIVLLIVLIAVAVFVYTILNDGSGSSQNEPATCNDRWKNCYEKCEGVPEEEKPSCRQNCEWETSNCDANPDNELGLTTSSPEEIAERKKIKCNTEFIECKNNCGSPSSSLPLDPANSEYDKCEINCIEKRSGCSCFVEPKQICQSKATINLLGCTDAPDTCALRAKGFYESCINPPGADDITPVIPVE